jgi:hypothetical protein
LGLQAGYGVGQRIEDTHDLLSNNSSSTSLAARKQRPLSHGGAAARPMPLKYTIISICYAGAVKRRRHEAAGRRQNLPSGQAIAHTAAGAPRLVSAKARVLNPAPKEQRILHAF